MATLCKNCSHALVFDPAKQKLVCVACGSTFFPEEVESEAKAYREDLNAESINKINGTDDKDLMDCYVYTCSECGGEIIVNGTEASTTCVYCGNPNVVFSRIAKQKCPEYVLPFSVTKEKALQIARERISKGFFVPKEIKNFTVDCCRGIYLPYWIVNADFYDAVVVQGQVRQGKSSVTKYFGRAGSMKLKNLPLDASRALSDETSAKLEPYVLRDLKPFDEDYLAGFYSNVSDVTYSDIRRAAISRAEEYFNNDAINDVSASGKKVISSLPSIKIDNDMVYAMLPAWFITFRYKGKHNTLLVNGETGKVVGALPWKKPLFYGLLIGLGILVTVACFFVFRETIPVFFSGRRSSGSRDGRGKIIGMLVAGIIALFSTGIRKVVKVVKNIKLTQDKAMFNFMKKRQG
ncbi:MAG: hypothetical protein IKH06_07420 [Clostridiales bacterium]|nr:hypothetical protein [Clostridiales bacterium]